MVRRIASGATTALATVHAAGVAHGSLGGGCVLLSTFDDAAAAKLTVCLDNFGFATMRRSLGANNNDISAPPSFDDDPVLVAQAAQPDLRVHWQSQRQSRSPTVRRLRERPSG